MQRRSDATALPATAVVEPVAPGSRAVQIRQATEIVTVAWSAASLSVEGGARKGGQTSLFGVGPSEMTSRLPWPSGGRRSASLSCLVPVALLPPPGNISGPGAAAARIVVDGAWRAGRQRRE